MKLLLVLHVMGGIFFLGNIITAAFWKLRADAGGDLHQIWRTATNVLIADYVFTLPGIVLLLTTGHMMVANSGYELFSLSWLGISYFLFCLSGLIWLLILLPTQNQMIKHAKNSLDQGKLTNEYKKSSKIWNVFGSLSTILPIIVIVLMLVKP